MKKSFNDVPAPELYTLRQIAWILGVGHASVARAIRLVRQPQCVTLGGVS
jgi:hypothetical protein